MTVALSPPQQPRNRPRRARRWDMTDARGHTIQVFHRHSAWPHSTEEPGGRRDLLLLRRRLIQRNASGCFVHLGALVVAVYAINAIIRGAHLLVTQPTWTHAGLFILWLAGLGLVCVAMRRSLHAGSAGDIADELLAMGRCPSCAYRIAGLPAERDGCTVCPECGAAWRLATRGPAPVATDEPAARDDRVGRPHQG